MATWTDKERTLHEPVNLDTASTFFKEDDMSFLGDGFPYMIIIHLFNHVTVWSYKTEVERQEVYEYLLSLIEGKNTWLKPAE